MAESGHRLRDLTMPSIAAGLVLVMLAAAAMLPGKGGGKEVYERSCASCHAGGRDGAPRVGDRDAWGARAARGLSNLSESAITGVRKMPPHGGKLVLSDLELKRAITYMVNQSGGKWAEPIDRANPPAPRSGESLVHAYCGRCHQTGEAGAARIGDREAWARRARGGMDGLVRSAIQGHGGMPARGGMAELTDAEIRLAIAYMVERSAAPKR